jgi:hypothetical protein
MTFSAVNPPAGLTIDPNSGVVNWTPSASELGANAITLQATNLFGSSSLTITINVAPDVPVPGFVFTNTSSPTFNVVGFPIGLQITDASNTPSTYSVVSAASNVSIDPNTGVVNWTPTPDQLGGVALTFQLTNSFGTALITVNPALYITDAPSSIAVTGTNGWTPTVTWTPPQYNDNLITGYHFMISGPDFLNEDYTVSGAVTPTNLWLSYNPGSYILNMQTIGTNGEGLWTSVAFDYNPVLPYPLYQINSNGGQPIGVVGQPMSIQLSDLNTVYNPTMTSTYSLVSGPAGMTVDPTTGLVTWTPTPDQIGTQSMDFRLTNSAGTADLPLTFTVSDFATAPQNVAVDTNQLAPVVSWTAPTTIAGDAVASDTIVATGQAGTTFTYIASGTATSASLTGLPADTYSVTVQAFDATNSPGDVSTPVTFSYDPNVPVTTYTFTSNGGASYAVVGQTMTAQITDLHGNQGDSFAIVSGPADMTIDQTGLLSWTPTVADIGYAYPVVAVTNSYDTSYVYLTTLAAFASPVTYLTASGSASAGTIDVAWSAPATAFEPIAGYTVTLTWTDSSGMVWSTTGSTAAGVTTFSTAAVTGISTYTVTVNAVDAAGNPGAPSASIAFTLT